MKNEEKRTQRIIAKRRFMRKRRVSERPGPVIDRSDLVEAMNRELANSNKQADTARPSHLPMETST